jgi:hypothetical protein
MKKGKLLAAIDDYTLSMEHLNEFIYLGDLAVQRNALRNPDYFFAELNEKVRVLKNKMDAVVELI